jgi:putative membrane-bound dehydrogenase-like protein
MRFLSLFASSCWIPAVLLAAPTQPEPAHYNFPIYTNLPPGRQVGGQHTAATTPTLSPAEAQQRFTVPPGFEVRLFAAEPAVVNPVAMTWDERGRLWVVELYEYPMGAAAGQTPRDRIKILEDVNADGRADRVHVWADGLNLATGILLGNGGAYVGQAPHLLFLQDTTGDDRADRREILMTGFGLQDRHELLNGFAWGPDGWLYMTHGVFTYSTVRQMDDPEDDGVEMNAALARYHPRSQRFEVFADGTSNPWGVDFDRAGNAFVSACVIDHLFHLAPGGIYVRQAGAPTFPYAYQLLPSIVDHRHHMAAYAGVQVYQGDQYPPDYRGTILMGNIHDNAVHQDRLTPNGSSFTASFIRDFLRANDPWFRPVSVQVGPDGALWVMDWHDKYPCYQNALADPDGVDREHGRIWRVVYVGDEPGKAVPSRPRAEMDLTQSTPAELVALLEHSNAWHRRTAQRLLTERRPEEARSSLEQRFRQPGPLEPRLATLWTLHGTEWLNENLLAEAAVDSEPAIRAWAARLTGERGNPTTAALSLLVDLAADPDPTVRLAAATAARQFASGALTVNTPPRVDATDIGPVLDTLVRHSADARDPLLPFIIWMAAEPGVARNPTLALSWLLEHGPATLPLSGQLAAKALRRIADLNQPNRLDEAITFINAAADRSPPLTLAAMDGLLQGLQGRLLLPTTDPGPILDRLADLGHADLAARARQLGTLWGDAAAVQATLRLISNPSAPLDDRRRAVQTARTIRNDEARDALLALIESRPPEPLLIDAIQALGDLGGDATGRRLLGYWSEWTPAARRAAAETVATRPRWALTLLALVQESVIAPGDLPATVIRSLTQSKDNTVRTRAAETIGRYRESTPDKLALMEEKRLVALQGEPDLARGREITEQLCLVCHQFHSEGMEVGPDLTGVGRSTLDTLLAHIIDPNQVIGIGYENVEVETHDGRVVSGRLIEDTDDLVRLLVIGGREEVIARTDIDFLHVSELSVMPEGLEQIPDDDFRDMIWYLLNPPQDNRPMTPELRRQLIGEPAPPIPVK